MSDNKIQATINGDNIELKDDTYQYVSIPISEWQELKDAVDSQLPIKRRLTDQEEIEQIKAEPELFEKMTYTGLEMLYAKDRACHLSWDIKGYVLTLVDYNPFSKDEKRFDNADELKTEFLKLSDRNNNRDWNQDFEDFMFGINDTKQYYDID